jgi:peptidoglycan/LPS O-acetylase OafA/YrhL
MEFCDSVVFIPPSKFLPMRVLPMFTEHKHIPALDGIRALAFVMVYASHMHLRHSFTGGLGVSIFFFLS